MPLAKLQFRPGINRESTSYANEGGWFDCDKVRFHLGYPEKIGGWQKYSSSTYLGTARALHNWIALDGSNYMGVGTNFKYYVEEGGSFSDITPIRATTSAGDVTFSATNGSTTLTVSDTGHGADENDFVTFSGAATLGGLVTAEVLNQEYQITQIVDANSYEVTLASAANASDTGNGGASVVGTYQINVGLDTQVGGTGWGASTWSRGTWGSAATIGTDAELRLWSHDNFGEDLLINPRDSAIYYWDKSSTLSARAVEIGTLGGASNTPTIAKQILVSDNDRHVIAFGVNALGSADQDPLLIRFSDQESLTDWTPTATNTAGDLRLGSGSEFITAIETKREILVFTDRSLHSMRFVGPPFTFGVQQLASSVTIMGPNAGVAAEDFVFWMGQDNFYIYDGRTANLPCTVRDYVFGNFNQAQSSKVVAGLNSQWGEVFWFYPSSGSDENDSYVVFNYLEKAWYYGSLSRTAWRDRGLRPLPIAAGADSGSNYLYNHEIGSDDDGSAMDAYIESSQIDIGDGDKFLLIHRLIPDLTFTGSTSGTPVANFTLETREYPGAAYDTTVSKSVTRSATSPVEQFTNQLDMRLRGRSFAIKVDSDSIGTRWRIGAPRVDIREDGRR
jgi:hypothetical protein